VDGLKFVGRYGTATVTVPPLAKIEVTGRVWAVVLATVGDELEQADATTATPPRRVSAVLLSSTAVTERP
jgi:hypothetical protein